MAKKKVSRRPLSIRERQNREQNKEEVVLARITNTSKQMVPIHLRPPIGRNGKRIDFYFGAEDKRLSPNKSIVVDLSRTYDSQITRLKQKKMISVIIEQDKVEEE